MPSAFTISVERIKKAHLHKYRQDVSGLPPDVRVVYYRIHEQMFNPGLRLGGGVYKECGIGNNNISLHFKCHIGLSPQEYVLSHRLMLAKRLLKEFPVLPIYRVALAVGYESMSAFTQLFRRREGFPPSSYRENLREKQRDG